MHLFIFANFTAKIIKTFGLKLYYVLNFLHIVLYVKKLSPLGWLN